MFPRRWVVIIGAFYCIFDMGVTMLNYSEDIIGATVANRLFGTKDIPETASADGSSAQS